MKPVLGLLSIYILVHLGIIASGVGIGLVLRWMLPSVSLGTGILAGVASTGLSLHYFLRLLTFIEYYDLSRGEDDDFPPPIQVYPVGPTRSVRKRKRR